MENYYEVVSNACKVAMVYSNDVSITFPMLEDNVVEMVLNYMSMVVVVN